MAQLEPLGYRPGSIFHSALMVGKVHNPVVPRRGPSMNIISMAGANGVTMTTHPWNNGSSISTPSKTSPTFKAAEAAAVLELDALVPSRNLASPLHKTTKDQPRTPNLDPGPNKKSKTAHGKNFTPPRSNVAREVITISDDEDVRIISSASSPLQQKNNVSVAPPGQASMVMVSDMSDSLVSSTTSSFPAEVNAVLKNPDLSNRSAPSAVATEQLQPTKTSESASVQSGESQVPVLEAKEANATAPPDVSKSPIQNPVEEPTEPEKIIEGSMDSITFNDSQEMPPDVLLPSCPSSMEMSIEDVTEKPGEISAKAPVEADVLATTDTQEAVASQERDEPVINISDECAHRAVESMPDPPANPEELTIDSSAGVSPVEEKPAIVASDEGESTVVEDFERTQWIQIDDSEESNVDAPQTVEAPQTVDAPQTEEINAPPSTEVEMLPVLPLDLPGVRGKIIRDFLELEDKYARKIRNEGIDSVPGYPAESVDANTPTANLAREYHLDRVYVGHEFFEKCIAPLQTPHGKAHLPSFTNLH